MKKFLSLIFLLAFSGSALSATATLKWTNPTLRTDGTTITGALTTYVYDTVTPAGGTQQPPVLLTMGVTTGYVTPPLVVGIHTFQISNCEASTLTTAGACSAYSNPLTVTILPAPAAVTDLTDDLGSEPPPR